MKKTKIRKRNNAGMTMVEVLLGFTILVLIMGMLSGIIAFSKNVYMESVDLKKNQETLQQEIYKKNVSENSASVKQRDSLIMKPVADMPDSNTEITLNMKVYQVSGKELLGDASTLDVYMYIVQ